MRNSLDLHVPEFLAPRARKETTSPISLDTTKLDTLFSRRKEGLFQGMQTSKSIELIWYLPLHIIVAKQLDNVLQRIIDRQQSPADKKGRPRCYAYFDMLSFIYSYTVLLEEIRQDRIILSKVIKSLKLTNQAPRNIILDWVMEAGIKDALNRLSTQETKIQNSDNSPLPPRGPIPLRSLSKLPKPETWVERGTVQGRADAPRPLTYEWHLLLLSSLAGFWSNTRSYGKH
jgi:hypothetical protein